MKPNYYEIFEQDYKDLCKDCPIDVRIISIYRDGLLTKNILRKYMVDDHPIVFLAFCYRYITDESITEYSIIQDNECDYKCIDIEKEYPVNVEFKINILTRDIKQNIALEEYISSKYITERVVNIPHPDDADKFIEVKIKYDENNKILRNKHESIGGAEAFSSEIGVSCKGCVTFEESFHPAEVAFDENVQYDIIKRVAALYELSYNYKKKAFDKDIHGDSYKEYIEKSDRLNLEAKELIKSTEILNQEYVDPYYAKEILSLSDQHNKNIKETIDSIQEWKDLIDFRKNKFYEKIRSEKQKKDYSEEQRVNKEKEKVERRKKIEQRLKQIEEVKTKKLLSHGDPMANVFTDVVVSEINTKFENKIPVYGGTNYMDYYSDYEKGTIKYPSICIIANDEFSSDFHTYTVIDQNGNKATRMHDYSTSIPYAYSVAFCVNYDVNTKDWALQIIDYLKRTYYNPVTLYAANPIEQGTFLPITLRIEWNEQLLLKKMTDKGNLQECNGVETDYNGKYSMIINSVKYCNVYFSYDYPAETIIGNPWCQIMLLKRACFFKDIKVKLNKSIEKELPKRYKNLVEGKPIHEELKNDQAYLQLAKRYRERQPLFRYSFENAMKPISDCYPMFFDRVMAGWSYEQIEKEMKSFVEYYDYNYTYICDKLDIPDDAIQENSFALNPRSYLKAYMTSMMLNNLDILEAEYLNESIVIEKRKSQGSIFDCVGSSFLKAAISGKHKGNKEEADDYFDGIPKDYHERSQYYEEVLATANGKQGVNVAPQQYYDQGPQYYDEPYDEPSYNGGSSSGGSLLGDVFAVAAGNIIANKYEDHKKKKKKFDYRGTSSCQIGKPNPNAFTKGSCYINCVGCPIRWECDSYD